jgi:hypothetical protein
MCWEGQYQLEFGIGGAQWVDVIILLWDES